jgi:hypothetical protein
VRVQRHAGHYACELGPAALYNAIPVRGVWGAQNRERKSAMPKRGSRNLPTVQDVGEQRLVSFDWQLINVRRVEVVPDIIIARPVLTAKFARKR